MQAGSNPDPPKAPGPRASQLAPRAPWEERQELPASTGPLRNEES